jgi:N-acetylglutamate synthase-like GNAT family acetyltransferase
MNKDFKFTTKELKALDESELLSLIKLSPKSGLIKNILKNKHLEEYHDVVVSYCIDKNKYIGVCVANKSLYDRILMVFVKASYRRNGIGTKLVKLTDKNYKKYEVMPVDKTGVDFFNNLGFKKSIGLELDEFECNKE